MPVLKNEMVFVADGFVNEDPALRLRERAEGFVAGRKWETEEIHYGDQAEGGEAQTQRRGAWSMTFALGLDHVQGAKGEWFGDVKAIIDFVQGVAREVGTEFLLEFRLRSKLWYSCTLGTVDEKSSVPEKELEEIRGMLEAEIARARTSRQWWRQISLGLWVILSAGVIACVWIWWKTQR